MVVATFGPSTEWTGRQITFDGQQFLLEGFGRIMPADIVEYDRQGHLVWPHDEMRNRVYSLKDTPYRARGVMKFSGPQSPKAKRAFNVWVLVGLAVLVIGAAGAVVVSKDRVSASDATHVAETQLNAQTLRGFAWSYKFYTHRYPSVSEFNQFLNIDDVMVWPSNSYTGDPMVSGTGPGDFTYSVSPDGQSYVIEAYGVKGEVVAKVSNP